MRFAPLGIIALLLLGLLGLILLMAGGGTYDKLFLVMGFFAIVDLAAVIALAVWLFPRMSRQLDSPVLGFLAGLPVFLLLAAAVVIFFFATCYGIVVVTEPALR